MFHSVLVLSRPVAASEIPSGEHLGLGVGLIDASLDDVKNDRRSNIRAGAAVLHSYADDLEFDRDDLGAWAPAIAR